MKWVRIGNSMVDIKKYHRFQIETDSFPGGSPLMAKIVGVREVKSNTLFGSQISDVREDIALFMNEELAVVALDELLLQTKSEHRYSDLDTYLEEQGL